MNYLTHKHEKAQFARYVATNKQSLALQPSQKETIMCFVAVQPTKDRTNECLCQRNRSLP